MKNKIIFISIFVVILAAGIVFMVFLIQKQGSTVPESELIPGSEGQQPEEQQPEEQSESEIPQSTMIDAEYFTLILPPAWEGASEPDTLPIVVADFQEEITNEKAKEIDFRTNLSINRAQLTEGALLEDYIEDVKKGLINTIPLIEILKQEKTTLNDSEAYFLEIESIQEDLKFKTLVVFVAGKENIVWVLSFNTLEESRPNYEKVFNQIAQSFKIK